MENKQKRASRIRADILLIAALLLTAAIGAVYLFVFRKQGNVVRVTVDGELYATYALSRTVEEVIVSGDGHQKNRLIIRDGKAFIESADCPDGICVAHRPIFRDGESIVCLPHRVVVTVIAQEQADTPDIVA